MRWFLATVLATAILAGGCGSWRWPWRRETPEATAEAAKTVGSSLRTDAAAAKKALQNAHWAGVTAADTIRAAYAAAIRTPAAQAWAPRLAETTALLSETVIPGIDEGLRCVEAIQASADEVEALAAGIEAVRAERDEALEKAAKEKERADSAIRRWLTMIAVGAFLSGLASVAVFIWLSRKAGLALGVASAVTFAAAVAVERWLQWIQWGGLAVIAACIGLLAWAVWRNRKAFAEVVQGGDDVKTGMASLAARLKPDQLGAALASFGEKGGLFNATQKQAQSPATQAMVDELKENGDGNPET